MLLETELSSLGDALRVSKVPCLFPRALAGGLLTKEIGFDGHARCRLRALSCPQPMLV